MSNPAPKRLSTNPLYDRDAVVEMVRLIVPAGNVTEVRVLEAATDSDRRPHTESGYFNDPELLADSLATIRSAKGFYLVLNPVDSALLARTLDGAADYVVYTVAGHGLEAGRTVWVRGSSVTEYNGPQEVVAVTSTTFTTNRKYVSTSIGSAAWAHSGVNKLNLIDFTFHNDQAQFTYALENLNVPQVNIENCRFRNLTENTIKQGLINTEYSGDFALIRLRVVKNRFYFRSTNICRAIRPTTAASELLVSGKTIAWGNGAVQRPDERQRVPGGYVRGRRLEFDDVRQPGDAAQLRWRSRLLSPHHVGFEPVWLSYRLAQRLNRTSAQETGARPAIGRQKNQTEPTTLPHEAKEPPMFSRWTNLLARPMHGRDRSSTGKQKNGVRKPRSFESLEGRRMMSREAVLNFYESECISAADMTAGGWADEGQVCYSAFSRLFTSSNPWLDLNGDNVTNLTDANIAVNRIVDMVKTQYSPYDLEITVGGRSAAQSKLTDGTLGDVLVVVSAEYNTHSYADSVWGVAPWADFDNDRDEIVFAFGGQIEDRWEPTGDADRFINHMARTISHEMGHAFGLDHLPAVGASDASTHHLMNTGDARDFDHYFNFQDLSYTTESGRVQNAHAILSSASTLGPSTKPWAAVLRPGQLTVSGDNTTNTINVTTTANGEWTVSASYVEGGVTRTITASLDDSMPGLSSINPFDAPLTSLLVQGKDGHDRIDVSSSISVAGYLYGGNGNDVIHGGGGHDRIFGEDGHDTLYGRAGNDRLYGSTGNDYLNGESGNDWLYGNAGNDRLYGSTGDDYLFGGDNDDILSGDSGDDQLLGEAGRDLLVGGTGADHLRGGADEDLLIAGAVSKISLTQVQREWTRTDASHSTRVAHLKGTLLGGLNGTSYLTRSTVQIDDGAVDQLYGEDGRDWFWGLHPEGPDRLLFSEYLNDAALPVIRVF